MPKDKELADHERAHTGKPGAKARHGADVVGSVGQRDVSDRIIRAHNRKINSLDMDVNNHMKSMDPTSVHSTGDHREGSGLTTAIHPDTNKIVHLYDKYRDE